MHGKDVRKEVWLHLVGKRKRDAQRKAFLFGEAKRAERRVRTGEEERRGHRSKEEAGDLEAKEKSSAIFYATDLRFREANSASLRILNMLDRCSRCFDLRFVQATNCCGLWNGQILWFQPIIFCNALPTGAGRRLQTWLVRIYSAQLSSKF